MQTAWERIVAFVTLAVLTMSAKETDPLTTSCENTSLGKHMKHVQRQRSKRGTNVEKAEGDVLANKGLGRVENLQKGMRLVVSPSCLTPHHK